MNSTFLRDKFRLAVLLLAVAGALLRIEYLREYAAFVNFDVPVGADICEYDARAREISSGIPFPAVPESHAPLYSFFVAGLYRLGGFSLPFVRAAQLLLNYLAWLGLFFLTGRIGFSRPLRLVFLGLAMLLPTPVFHQGELISEALLLPLLTAALWLLYSAENTKQWKRLSRFTGAGVFAGLAALTHGMLLAFAGAELLWQLLRRRWKNTLAFGAGTALAIIPLITLKSIHYGQPTGIQERGAFNFYLGNNPGSTGGCYLRPGRRWRQLHRRAETEARERGISADRVWLERAGAFWRDAPLNALWLYLKKAILVWNPRELPAGGDPGALSCRSHVMFWGRFLVPGVFLLAFIGLFHICRKRDGRYVHFLLLGGALWALQILFVTSGRYRLAMFPAILLCAATGAAALGKSRHWFWFAPFLLLSSVPLYNFCADGRAEARALLGEAAYRKGDYRHASELLGSAIRRCDDPARMYNLLGALAERRGDRGTAEKFYRQAAALEPYMPEAWMNLGNLTGIDPRKSAEAALCFARAFGAGTSSADLHYNYALFLQRRGGKPEEIESQLRAATARNARHAPSLNALGALAMGKNDFAAAIEFFGRAIAAAPSEPGYRHNLEVARQMKRGISRRMRR